MACNNTVFDVVIIGAGISGLSAAYLLQQEYGELKTVVLEARDRVGGRTHTLERDEVKYVDLGGSYVGPTQNRILRMAKNLGIKTYKVFAEGKNTEHSGGRPSFYRGDYSTWNNLCRFGLLCSDSYVRSIVRRSAFVVALERRSGRKNGIQ